jgi:hypothetical protein
MSKWITYTIREVGNIWQSSDATNAGRPAVRRIPLICGIFLQDAVDFGYSGKVKFTGLL